MVSGARVVTDPKVVICRAESAPGNAPVIRRICLTSGGKDSSVLAHSCRDLYDELFHIDTGTALPGVRAFVEDFARTLGKPLRVVEAGDAYRRLVLGDDAWWPIYRANRRDGEGPDAFRDRVSRIKASPLATAAAKRKARERRMALGLHLAPLGFPGPAGHKFAYQRLKERQLEAGLREIRAEFGNGRAKQRIVMLSGVRLDESQRRKMTGAAQGEWERKGNQLWVNPLLDWTNADMEQYRQQHDLQPSDVAALSHKSGECNCLAFAAKGEVEFIRSLWPDWFAEVIEPLEREAEAKGLKRARWGWGAGDPPVGDVGPLCQGCELNKVAAYAGIKVISDERVPKGAGMIGLPGGESA